MVFAMFYINSYKYKGFVLNVNTFQLNYKYSTLASTSSICFDLPVLKYNTLQASVMTCFYLFSSPDSNISTKILT